MDPVSLAGRLDADFRTSCAALDRDEPWFASLDVTVGGKPRSYRIGKDRFPEQRILDWRHPLARLYYETAPGEAFELDEAAPRGFVEMAGVVEGAAAVTTQGRAVRRVDLRSRDGKYAIVANDLGFELEGARRPRGPETGLPDVLALLTPEQYRLITANRANPIIIQGRAGSGKTTVALHRVAWLTYADEDSTSAPVDPSKVLVVMFNKALSLFVKNTLKPLKLEAATLDTFHGWALGEIRRAYKGDVQPDVGERAGKDVAVALKKQVGILRAIDAFVIAQTRALDKWLAEKLAPYKAGAWLDKFRSSSAPVLRRLVGLRTEALAARDSARGVEQKRLTQVHVVLDAAITRMSLYKDELLKLLTDEALLANHLTATPDELSKLAEYQRSVQRDGASDRRPGPKVAFEDLALLLRLIEVKNGGFPNKLRDDDVRVYDHLVVDEAQDFGAVELAVLFGAVKARTGVTIVGDLNQKILPEVDFIGWDALAKELGIGGATVARLEVAHRSTRQIMAIADGIVGDKPSGGREGALPTLRLVESEKHKLAAAADIARAALLDNPNAHVCVVCPSKADVPSVVDQLRASIDRSVAVREGRNRDFEFAPGVTVTNYRQVKGLEFDVVIALDPMAKAYAATTQGRRNLYMVVTRAKDALHFVLAGEPTALLRDAIDGGLVEVRDESGVPEVQLTEDDAQPF
jgi:DNA helicase-2/ATP-dependent DNA helicase PcrA